MARRREQTSAPVQESRDGFFFLGNNLLLDFLNTRPILEGELTELLPDFAALVRWFHAANLLTPQERSRLQREWEPSDRAQKILRSLLEFRERFRKVVLGWERTGKMHHPAIRELNELLAMHPMRTRLKTGGRQLEIERYFEAREPEDLWAPLAHSAAMLFGTEDHKRVRKCDHCVGHFLDISKKGTRRWCSMKLCGNRHKVAAYAARQRLMKDA
ncbi:MAG TPA: ABATE domain-containing protein [Candidatus Sulfotelmatobacter sp.]|nr:ABATE domain-containing protein [Candidatus Sulfotelmatobacter sp.]